MIPLCSKRNQVYASIRENQPVVEKHFSSVSDWTLERAMYRKLRGTVPLLTVVHAESRLLVTRYAPYPTLLSELEQQENTGFSPAPWDALLSWLQICWQACGQLPDDGNLRNFLWDSERSLIIGLDLECFREYPSLEHYVPRLIASLLQYSPADTSLKMEVSNWMKDRLRLSSSSICIARKELSTRRLQKDSPPLLSGIVLAGGKSKRMGQNKADLPLLGKGLLQWQVDKLIALGADEILLSGSNCPNIPGTRVIPDFYPERGPLGGLHACLNAAKHTKCLVLSVDMPLVPLSALYHLSRSHRGNVTVLRHPNGIEPLIGVYEKPVSTCIDPLIHSGGAPVRAIQKVVPWRFWDYVGPPELLQNCNTPEEFFNVSSLAEQYTAFSLPL